MSAIWSYARSSSRFVTIWWNYPHRVHVLDALNILLTSTRRVILSKYIHTPGTYSYVRFSTRGTVQRNYSFSARRYPNYFEQCIHVEMHLDDSDAHVRHVRAFYFSHTCRSACAIERTDAHRRIRPNSPSAGRQVARRDLAAFDFSLPFNSEWKENLAWLAKVRRKALASAGDFPSVFTFNHHRVAFLARRF